jgi:hypothetical protein
VADSLATIVTEIFVFSRSDVQRSRAFDQILMS